MNQLQDTVTQHLAQLAADPGRDPSELLALVYEELRALAAAQFQHERVGHTLQPTALVHEAFVKLVGQDLEWRSRGQFFALASKAMRNILVDHARARRADKRGGGRPRDALTVSDAQASGLGVLDMMALDDALKRLAEHDERKARLVELRFFGGLTSEEAASVLNISRSTAAQDWRMARAWLTKELTSHG